MAKRTQSWLGSETGGESWSPKPKELFRSCRLLFSWYPEELRRLGRYSGG